MTHSEQTRAAPNPSDSVLYTLARTAMAADVATGETTWPRLDLNDPAQREFGDYELLEEIGRGGMGVVYRAHQRSLDREVAIKFIAAGIADSFNVARFLAEARAAAKLMHPNIVPVHEVDSLDGLHYFSMPLVRGDSLATRLESGPLASAVATALLLKICDAIDYAHRLGLLHLDLKPANILLDERNEPLIADFGLARHMDAKGGVDAQEVSGTPAFMAPEQILIKQYRLTSATDIYALGAILYRCLTGVSPHGEGKPDDVIRRAAAGRVRPPRELNPAIPRDLDAICMKCLELQPSDRYASVTALADDLRRVRDGLPVSVRRAGLAERAQRWFKREPKLAFASSAAALALLIGATATSWQWREASAQRDVAVAQRNFANAARKDAEQQRDLAQGIAELGAWLYTQSALADANASANRPRQEDKSIGERMLAWLDKRYPDDEHHQEQVLTAFANGLYSHGDGFGVETLLLPVVGVMGNAYRDQMITALVAGTEPNRYLLAAQLALNTEQIAARMSGEDASPTADEPSRFSGLLDQAIKAQPDSSAVWEFAAVNCASGYVHCRPDATRNLVRLDRDNAFPWLLRMMESEGGEARTALHEAARATVFRDNFNADLARYIEAVKKAQVPAPELLAGPARALFPKLPPELAIAAVESSGTRLTAWQVFHQRCNPATGYFKDNSAYADCKTVGLMMMRAKVDLLARMFGSNVVRRLSRGTPLEQEAIELRRRYAYTLETSHRLSPNQLRDYPFLKLYEDQIRLGELEALEQRLAHYGLPSRPPRDWQPQDPCILGLGEDQTACRTKHPRPQ
ncbi:serine/threonine-protein kinase [Thermomonas sp.]|uniref:serine/threonine-protein kinase n=2 Tax=Thermomonas sp. TaxID=1971895 RepID=UPI00260A1E18|nr:serine/threonine-protein kinase [Thermomonas sp.]MCO5055287.1 serine/threonine protein kinase [Thermomonas sp.]